jgi:Putative transposase
MLHGVCHDDTLWHARDGIANRRLDRPESPDSTRPESQWLEHQLDVARHRAERRELVARSVVALEADACFRQQRSPEHLCFDVSELHADAGMWTVAERHERCALALVFGAVGRKARGVEHVGRRPQPVVLSALDLVSRLCALVPPPGFHLTRYAGVLSSHATWRAEVVPKASMDPSLRKPQLSRFDSQGHNPAPPAQPEPRPAAGREPWAWLLRHVFDADLSVCPRCGHKPMRITALALTAKAIELALVRHGLAARAPPAGPTLEELGQLALSLAP